MYPLHLRIRVLASELGEPGTAAKCSLAKTVFDRRSIRGSTSTEISTKSSLDSRRRRAPQLTYPGCEPVAYLSHRQPRAPSNSNATYSGSPQTSVSRSTASHIGEDAFLRACVIMLPARAVP